MNNIDLCKSCFKSLACEMPHVRFSCTEFESEFTIVPDSNRVTTIKYNIDHPSHYNQGDIETIDSIKSVTGDEYNGYLAGNVIKYMGRYKHKGNPIKDLQKALWHIEKLIKEIEEKEIQK